MSKNNVFYTYFSIPISQTERARFRRNRFTGTLFIFQWNCAPEGNEWHDPGYGWGKWTKVTK